MCRNIRPLNNYHPPASDEEVEAAAAQFVRKVAGTRRPSLRNREPFERAVADIAAATRLLIDSLVTAAPPKNWEEEAAKAQARAAARQR